MSLYSTFKIATEKTVLAMPEVRVGYFPDVGVTHYFSRLQDGLGLYLCLTGNFIKGIDCVKAGFANLFIRSDKLLEVEEKLKK